MLIQEVGGFIFTLGYHPLKKSLLESSARVVGSAKAISVRNGPLFVI